jgi:hypothetical protein
MERRSTTNYLRARQRYTPRKTSVQAGGVLPVSYDYDGNRVVLLGKGLCNFMGEYKEYWSDFGGRINSDESAIDGSFREFHEETAYFFTDEIHDTRQLLQLSGSDKYVAFLAEVSYSPVHEIMSQVRYIEEKGTPYQKNHIEKTEYRWILLSDLLMMGNKDHFSEKECGIFPLFVLQHLMLPKTQSMLESLLTASVSELSKKHSFQNILMDALGELA